MSTSSPSLHQLALMERLHNTEALIGVVGLGYVGLPLSLAFAEKGYQVLGFDIDTTKIEAIQESKSYIHQIHVSEWQVCRTIV